MMDIKRKIASNLEAQVAEMGFATQGVEALRQGADVFRQRLQYIAPDRDTEHLAQPLFLLHEGATEAARLQGPDWAPAAALRAVGALLAAERLP